MIQWFTRQRRCQAVADSLIEAAEKDHEKAQRELLSAMEKFRRAIPLEEGLLDVGDTLRGDKDSER